MVDFWYSGLSGNGSTPGDKNTSGFSVRKNLPLDYRSNKQTSEATRMLNVPFPIIRLGEVYLNYAEALNDTTSLPPSQDRSALLPQRNPHPCRHPGL